MTEGGHLRTQLLVAGGICALAAIAAYFALAKPTATAKSECGQSKAPGQFEHTPRQHQRAAEEVKLDLEGRHSIENLTLLLEVLTLRLKTTYWPFKRRAEAILSEESFSEEQELHVRVKFSE